MPLVDDGDVQNHLPFDKLKVEEIPDDLVNAKEGTERIVRGYLAGVIDSAVLATWTTPAATPDQVREIAAMLTAAHIYRLRYSEDSLDDPQYAQTKYDAAMKMLMDIVSGNLVLDGVTEQTQFDNTYFYPNNTADDPKFAMSDRY